MTRTTAPIWFLLVPLAASANDLGSAPCGNPNNYFTPPVYDYTEPVSREQVEMIESFHFDTGVETLTKGLSTENLRGDIDFLLRHVPNHHRGLYAAARHEVAEGTRPEWRSTDCYFTRAMYFRPDDRTVRMIYGIFLARRGDNEAAIERYNEAVKLGLDSPELHYNFGLAYIELGEEQLALEHAKRAYDDGFPLPALKTRLAKLGVWQEKTDREQIP